jgi:hypothetical protein
MLKKAPNALQDSMQFTVFKRAIVFPEHQRTLCSAVLSERIVAFCAAQKLGRRFISAPRLHLPNVCSIIAAFGALDSNGWKGSEFLLFFAYHRYKLLWIMLDFLADFGFHFLG